MFLLFHVDRKLNEASGTSGNVPIDSGSESSTDESDNDGGKDALSESDNEASRYFLSIERESNV